MNRIKDPISHWTNVATQELKGKTITIISTISDEELDALMWSKSHSSVLIIELSGETIIVPCRDDEMNGPGCLVSDAGIDELTGQKIKDVRYLSPKQCQKRGWHESPPVIITEKGNKIVFQQDPEGNDGGSAYVQTSKEEKMLPTINLSLIKNSKS